AHGAQRAVEGGKEAVARGLELAAAVALELGAQGRVVLDQHRLPALVADLGELRGRADDVREEKRGDDAAAGLIGRLREGARAGELKALVGLIADHPGVVPGRNLVGVARDEVHGRAVLHGDVKLSLDDEADVMVLALFRPGDRLDVLGPFPSGVEGELAEDDVVDGDETYLAVGKFPDLLRVLEAPALQSRHGRSLSAFS